MSSENRQPDEKLVGKISKNAKEEFRVLITSYHGHRFVDLRLFVVNADGSWVPTKKGVGIRADLLGKVGEALKQAQEAARAEGLI